MSIEIMHLPYIIRTKDTFQSALSSRGADGVRTTIAGIFQREAARVQKDKLLLQGIVQLAVADCVKQRRIARNAQLELRRIRAVVNHSASVSQRASHTSSSDQMDSEAQRDESFERMVLHDESVRHVDDSLDSSSDSESSGNREVSEDGGHRYTWSLGSPVSRLRKNSELHRSGATNARDTVPRAAGRPTSHSKATESSKDTMLRRHRGFFHPRTETGARASTKLPPPAPGRAVVQSPIEAAGGAHARTLKEKHVSRTQLIQFQTYSHSGAARGRPFGGRGSAGKSGSSNVASRTSAQSRPLKQAKSPPRPAHEEQDSISPPGASAPPPREWGGSLGLQDGGEVHVLPDSQGDQPPGMPPASMWDPSMGSAVSATAGSSAGGATGEGYQRGEPRTAPVLPSSSSSPASSGAGGNGGGRSRKRHRGDVGGAGGLQRKSRSQSSEGVEAGRDKATGGESRSGGRGGQKAETGAGWDGEASPTAGKRRYRRAEGEADHEAGGSNSRSSSRSPTPEVLRGMAEGAPPPALGKPGAGRGARYIPTERLNDLEMKRRDAAYRAMEEAGDRLGGQLRAVDPRFQQERPCQSTPDEFWDYDIPSVPDSTQSSQRAGGPVVPVDGGKGGQGELAGDGESKSGESSLDVSDDMLVSREGDSMLGIGD